MATRHEILDAAWSVARTEGIAGLTLRQVAEVVGMRPPSLYSHFDSKDALYDAMFQQAWQTFLDVARAASPTWPHEPRTRLRALALHYFDFAVAEPSRFVLMNVPVLPTFRPSEQAFSVAILCYEELATELESIGIRGQPHLDTYTALVSGFISQQLANDPGGDRWRTQLMKVLDLIADDLDLAQTPRR